MKPKSIHTQSSTVGYITIIITKILAHHRHFLLIYRNSSLNGYQKWLNLIYWSFSSRLKFNFQFLFFTFHSMDKIIVVHFKTLSSQIIIDNGKFKISQILSLKALYIYLCN